MKKEEKEDRKDRKENKPGSLCLLYSFFLLLLTFAIVRKSMDECMYIYPCFSCVLVFREGGRN